MNMTQNQAETLLVILKSQLSIESIRNCELEKQFKTDERIISDKVIREMERQIKLIEDKKW